MDFEMAASALWTESRATTVCGGVKAGRKSVASIISVWRRRIIKELFQDPPGKIYK
jgi:hypothetical protein